MSWRKAAVGTAEKNRNKKVNEIVRTIVGLVMKEGDTVVAPTASQSYGKT